MSTNIVRPLEWFEVQGEHIAADITGVYRVSKPNENGMHILYRNRIRIGKPHPTTVDAMVAAQNDFEKLVRSVLTFDPDKLNL